MVSAACRQGEECKELHSRRHCEIGVDMSVDIDMKACTILERFGEEFGGAEVDYTCTQDLHEFLITTAGGVTHEVGFTERVLLLKDIPDIEEVVSRLSDEIKASAQPRKIRIGSRGNDPDRGS